MNHLTYCRIRFVIQITKVQWHLNWTKTHIWKQLSYKSVHNPLYYSANQLSNKLTNATKPNSLAETIIYTKKERKNERRRKHKMQKYEFGFRFCPSLNSPDKRHSTLALTLMAFVYVCL